jgi:hypothetical protein
LSEYEKIQVTKPQQLAGNLIALIWILIGAYGCWLINPLYGWLFLGFSAFVVYGIIRRMTCSSCYYCKSCTKGMAKTSLLFIGATRIPGLSKSSIWGMNAALYVVLTLIPVWVIVTAQSFSLQYLVLAGLIAVSAVSLIGKAVYRPKKPQTSQ